MKYLNYLFALLISFIPVLASAHVKWFVDSNQITSSESFLYSLDSREVIVWSIVSVAVVLFFAILDKKIRKPKSLENFGLRNEKIINRISQVILGLFLVSVSFLWNIIIVPEFHVEDSLAIGLQYVQILVGLMYVFNVYPKIASYSLLALCFVVFFKFGFVSFLENAILVSLALYFLIINLRRNFMTDHAVEIVRIGTGISLVTLAFTEKLLYPELSMSFLDVHSWNFMQAFFPWFTNNLFVLSTGFAEMIFGILFIMGYMTRTTTILIAIFFACSVTAMLLQFGEWEVEDLVVYSAAILFIFFGHGRTKFFHFVLPERLFLQKSLFGK